MVTRTFLDKCTTIVKNNNENYGLHPIVMLNHGFITSRFLIHFDVNELLEKTKDGTFGFGNVKHILRMTNCASIDERKFHNLIHANDKNGVKKRAVSFDVLAFRIPKKWDEGVGFDNTSDFWLSGDGAVSYEGCNWYQAYNGFEWDEEGIYSTDTLTKEYDKFSRGEESIIIGRQHFDHGNEDLEIDVTDYVNSMDTKYQHNNGICLCFTPFTEESAITMTQYVGFFGNNTNTFFEPFIETRCDSVINDNRKSFYLGKDNKLYLYALIGGELVNLDNIPTCDVDGSEYEVKQQGKGVYYIDIKLSKKDYEKDTILYDTWSNLSYNGEEIDDVEQEFVTLSSDKFFKMSGAIESQIKYNASISGINDGEHINSEDTRLVNVFFKKKYSKEYTIVENAEYRLYIKNGIKEIDVIQWDGINSTDESNFFYLETGTLIPSEYFIDIKCKIGNEIKTFKNVVRFTIENNMTNQKK